MKTGKKEATESDTGDAFSFKKGALNLYDLLNNRKSRQMGYSQVSK